jgi:hypothetical protein
MQHHRAIAAWHGALTSIQLASVPEESVDVAAAGAWVAGLAALGQALSNALEVCQEGSAGVDAVLLCQQLALDGCAS